METEREFQQAVLDLAAVTGWRAYHTFDSRRSVAGFPDLTLARPGDAVIFAELKTAQGRLTPEQRWWWEVLQAAERVEAYVWRPGDFAEIDRRLQWGRGQPWRW